LIVGLACRYRVPTAITAERQRQDIATILSAACQSATTALESVDAHAGESLNVRVLDLPAFFNRRHC
jgi:hypothetical protein